MIFQPFFYALRPLFTNPKVPLKLEYVNTVIQLTFNYLVFDYFGGKVLFYLLGGSLMAMGFHPVAGHFISGKKEIVYLETLIQKSFLGMF